MILKRRQLLKSMLAGAMIAVATSVGLPITTAKRFVRVRYETHTKDLILKIWRGDTRFISNPVKVDYSIEITETWEGNRLIDVMKQTEPTFRGIHF